MKNLKTGSSWITWVGPKSHDKCPYKKKRTGEKGHVKMEAEVEVMLPQVKEDLQPPGAGRDEK